REAESGYSQSARGGLAGQFRRRRRSPEPEELPRGWWGSIRRGALARGSEHVKHRHSYRFLARVLGVVRVTLSVKRQPQFEQVGLIHEGCSCGLKRTRESVTPWTGDK